MSDKNIKTFNQLVKVLEDVATRHYQINSFGNGPSFDIGASEANIHPTLWVNPISGTMERGQNENYASFEAVFNLKVFDLIDKGEYIRDEVHSDTLDILRDIVTEFTSHPYYTRSKFDMVGDLSFTPFSDKFDDEVTGWEVDIRIRTPYQTSFCGIPISNIPDYNFPISSTSGGTIQILDKYTTDARLSGSTIVFDRNDRDDAYSVDLSTLVTTGSTGEVKLIPLIYAENAETSIIPALGSNGVTLNTSYSSILGGRFNSMVSSNDYSTILGGKFNTLSNSQYSTLGGLNNVLSNSNKTVVFGGQSNQSINSNYSLLGGGFNNRITASSYSTIGGGQNNQISGLTNTHIIGSNITADKSNTLATTEIRHNSDLNNEIQSDSDNDRLHIFSNFLREQNIDWYGPNIYDYTKILDTHTTMDDDTGQYPRIVNHMLESDDGTYREQGGWVTSDLDYSHFIENFYGGNSDGTGFYWNANINAINNQSLPFTSIFSQNNTNTVISRTVTDESHNNGYTTNLNMSNTSTGLFRNGSTERGDYTCFFDQSDSISQFLRNDYTTSGKRIQGGARLNPLERFSFQRLEEISVGSGTWLEQDFGFYGTESTFGQRTSRFYHVTSNGIVNQLQIQNDNVKLGYKQNDSIGRRAEFNITNDGFSFTKRDIDVLELNNLGNFIRTAQNNTHTTIDNNVNKGLLRYSVDPKTTNGWNARSIPDRQYVDDQISTVKFDKLIYVEEKSDFPTPVGGVITLEADKTYILVNDIDLTGDRLVTSGVVNIFGQSSETCILTSTGLGVGVPLLTSTYTVVLEKITIGGVNTAIDIDGTITPIALDWKAVNFKDVPNIGTIDTCDNFIYDTGAFLNSKGLVFDGTIGTIGINNSLLSGDGLAGNILELTDTLTVTRRFRVNYSSFVATSSTIGINVSTGTTIPTESYILDTVNFGGGGTYLSGVDVTTNKTLFVNCVGIDNTSVNGQMYMNDNATTTTVTATDTFYKVSGTTTSSSENQKYSHTDNRLTNEAIIERKYLVQATLTFTSGNNNVCKFGFYDSKIGDIRTPSITKSTANAAGRAENISLHCVVNHSDGDYIELHCSNTTSTTDITVEDMNVVITQII